MNFIFEQIRAGGDRNLAYLIGDRAAGVAAVVDPSFEPQNSLDRAMAQGLNIRYILNTHGHPDHVAGNGAVKHATGADVCAFAGSPAQPARVLADGDRVMIGSIAVDVLHVPGHYPDHVVFFLPEEHIAITGDLLFVGKIGGTANDEDACTEYGSLQRLLTDLPDDTTIWPGHDYGCRPASTMGLERRNNPFLTAPDLEAFLRLKGEWRAFKTEHGLR